MEENKEEDTGTESKNEKPWLEKQLEKLIGKQENMQPIIRALFSIAGFAAGVLVGNWLLGKEKDRRIEWLANEVSELREKKKEQEQELKAAKSQMEESKEKALRFEAELKVIKERGEYGRELTAYAPAKRTGSFLN